MSTPKPSGYQFIHRPEDGNYASIHVWSNKANDTLCPTPQYVFTKDYVKTETPPAYGNMCPVCQRIISGRATQVNKPKKEKRPKIAPPRPEEDEYLKRWKGARETHPTFWEKMDKDPVYNRSVKDRGDNTMSNQWGIGKPRGPR